MTGEASADMDGKALQWLFFSAFKDVHLNYNTNR